MREFLHVDDRAVASVHVIELPIAVYCAQTRAMLSHMNVGTGVDCTIRELGKTIARATGFCDRLVWHAIKPDGAPQKLTDESCLTALGWRARIGLEDSMKETQHWFIKNIWAQAVNSSTSPEKVLS